MNLNILGKDYYNITAYKNDSTDNPNYLYDKIYTGIQWQCIEYVRRWYILVFQLTFPSVKYAIDLWNIEYVYHPITKKQFRFYSIQNGSNTEPNVGDIIIFKQTKFYPYGHVAIVSRVTKDAVYLAEQNMSTQRWVGKYSRKIKRRVDTLMDPLVLGWKTIHC